MRLEIDFGKLLENIDFTSIILSVLAISCIYAIATIVIMLFLKGSK